MQCYNEGGESEYSNVMICETKGEAVGPSRGGLWDGKDPLGEFLCSTKVSCDDDHNFLECFGGLFCLRKLGLF